MARITFSMAEAVRIINSNGLVSGPITEIRTEGDKISVKFKTGWPAPKYIRVGIEYADFDNGIVTFSMATNRLIDKFDWLVRKLLKSLHLPDYVSQCEYPRVCVDINKVLADKIKGLQIENIAFENGQFCVTISTR
jgi:hypothetical protein